MAGTHFVCVFLSLSRPNAPTHWVFYAHTQNTLTHTQLLPTCVRRNRHMYVWHAKRCNTLPYVCQTNLAGLHWIALLQEHCCKSTHGCGFKLASTDPCHHKYTHSYIHTFAAMSSRSPQSLKLRHTGFRNVTTFHSQDLGRGQWGM